MNSPHLDPLTEAVLIGAMALVTFATLIPSPSPKPGRREPDSKSLSQIWERDLG
jgi:hypothetical protein